MHRGIGLFQLMILLQTFGKIWMATMITTLCLNLIISDMKCPFGCDGVLGIHNYDYDALVDAIVSHE